MNWLECDLKQLIDKIAENYNNHYNDGRPTLHTTDKWCYGFWMMGQDYRNKSIFYGAYPASVLKRYDVMFDFKKKGKKVLHLFSGMLPKNDDYIRFDLIQDADVKGNAEELSKHFEPNTFDIIFADPPYTDEDATKYGTPMVGRNKVVKECYKVLKKGGLLIWLDMVLPMYKKIEFDQFLNIGLVRSTNHRFRIITGFRKRIPTSEEVEKYEIRRNKRRKT